MGLEDLIPKAVMPEISPREKLLREAGVVVLDLTRQSGELFESAEHKKAERQAEEDNKRNLFNNQETRKC